MNLEKLFLNHDNMILMLKERKELLILLKLGRLMMESGLVGSEMDTVFKSGQMALSTKDNGKITEHMVKENSFILMVTFTMVNG